MKTRMIVVLFCTMIVAAAQNPAPELALITEEPRDREVTVGATVFFKCRSSSSVGQVSWSHNGREIDPLPDREILPDGTVAVLPVSPTQVLEDGTLVVRKATAASQGIYQCTVTTEDGHSKSRPASLTITARTEIPRITHRPVKTNVKVGGLIVLDCLASGYPPPTYSWYKDGGRLSPAHDRFTLARNGSLVISNAQLDDSAHYRCSASNYLGKASSSAKVEVDTADPPQPPRITTRPRGRTVQEGTIVEMTCIAQGSPYPDITWWNNRRIVTGSRRVTVSNGGQHLRIQDVEVYDQGEYICVAENSLGKEQVVASLTVIPDTSSLPRPSATRWTTTATTPVSPLSTRQNKNKNSISNSNISNSLKEDEADGDLHKEEAAEDSTPHLMEATPGSTVQLPCKLQALPSKVSWYKDGHPMQAKGGYRMASDGSLLLYNVTTRDSGEYSCGEGRSRRSTSLFFHVLASPINTRQQTRQQDAEAAGGQQAASRPATANEPPGGQQAASTAPRVNSNLGSRRREPVEPRAPVVRHETDLSYDVKEAGEGDSYVGISIEEARLTVDRALNSTVKLLFQHHQHTNRTPTQLLNIFRFPSGNERELARAGEIYHRTLELVEAKIKEGGRYNLSAFSLANLISPANLELIGNLSGCEANRRQADCEDVCFHSRFRSADGSCNNWQNPLWGASLIPFRRILPPQYENGFNTPIGYDPGRLYHGHRKPSARLVSSRLIRAATVTPDPRLTHMVMQWGQFLDHDLDHSLEAVSRETFGTGQTCGSSCEPEPPCFPIPIPPDDPRYSEAGRCIEFTRSSAACGSGATGVFFERLQQREQVNQLTSFIDASQVYGSSRDQANHLRNLTNEFGRLREGPTYDYGPLPLLPFNDGHPVDCRRDPRESSIGCFLAGDIRANEQLGLLSMHVLWFREHNRLAEALREINPHWDGDRLYQEARKIVGAEMQHMTYSHWLPNIIGRPLESYRAYNPTLNPTVANVFAASAFRFGHTLIQPILRRLDANLSSIPEGDLALHRAFFAPWRLVEEGGLDPLLRGLFASPGKLPAAGQVMNDELTERLFQVAHTVALDLAALNIQRGRDHGIPPYTDWLKYCALGNVTTWQQLEQHIQDAEKIATLRKLYGEPGNIDLWVGSLLEPQVEGGRVGPTVQCLLIQQFLRLRDGDRFWYESPATFRAGQLDQLKQVSLARILCDNGDDIRRVPRDVFINTKLEDFVDCSEIPRMSLAPWTDCKEEEDESPFLHERRRRSAEVRHSALDNKNSVEAQLKQKIANLEAKLQHLEGTCRSAKGSSADSTSADGSGTRGSREPSTTASAERDLTEGLESVLSMGVGNPPASTETHDQPEKDLVCVTVGGHIRSNGERWLVEGAEERCALCSCEEGRSLCSKHACPG